MDNYNFAVPITQSLFKHCNPQEMTVNGFEKKCEDESKKVSQRIEEGRDKEGLEEGSN